MRLPTNPLLRSALVTLVVFFFTGLSDLLLGREGISRIDLMILGDALAALAFGALYLIFAVRAQEKQRELDRQLRMIAEMNHHIRNALQAIVYAHTLDSTKYSTVIEGAVKRIEWALSEILPANGRKPSNPAAPESDKIDKIHATE